MNKLAILICFLIAAIKLTAQQNNEIIQYSLKLDSSYLFIDNSNRNWYTLELETDTFFTIEENFFFINGKTIQIGSMPFDNGKSGGVMGSIKAEEYALSGHKKWELDYQKKSLHKKLKNDEEFYYGQNGKPFLIWWLETPKNSKVPERVIEANINNSYKQNFSDTTAIELNVTHQLFLDFIIHGNTSVSLSMPVLENETLLGEINKLKKIANTLNVYGSYIDLKVLSDRKKDKEKVVLKDSLGLIELEIPDWMNIVRSPFKNSLVASFPEKDNITNATTILWEYKSDSTSFQDFINKRQVINKNRENVKTVLKEEKIQRDFYTSKNSWFHCQDVFIEGSSVYCFINFTATSTTYDFNINRLNELIERIILK